MPPRDWPPNQLVDIGGKALTCANVSGLVVGGGGNAARHAPNQLNPYTSPRKLAVAPPGHRPRRPRPIVPNPTTGQPVYTAQAHPPSHPRPVRYRLTTSRTCRHQPRPTRPAVPGHPSRTCYLVNLPVPPRPPTATVPGQIVTTSTTCQPVDTTRVQAQGACPCLGKSSPRTRPQVTSPGTDCRGWRLGRSAGFVTWGRVRGDEPRSASRHSGPVPK
jgi:hypothetical protein